MSTGDPIARGNIILGADTTPLEAGLSAAKEQAKAAGEEIQQAVNKPKSSGAIDIIDTGPDPSRERAKREHEAWAAAKAAQEQAASQYAKLDTAAQTATNPSRWQRLRAAINGANVEVGGLSKSLSVIGQAGGIIGIFTAATVGAFKLGVAIREQVVSALESGKDKADNFKDSLDRLNVPDSIEKTKKELERVNSELAILYEENSGRGLFGGDAARLEEQRTELEKTLITLGKTKKAQDDYNKSLAQQREYERQILQLQQQIQSANQASFGRIEASVEKIGQYVELMSRTIRRNG